MHLSNSTFTTSFASFNKSLDSLFNLDSFATNYIQQNWQTNKVKFLPDPVQVYPSSKSVDELKNLVNEFSNFARMPAIQPEPNDLNAIIRETLTLYQEGHRGGFQPLKFRRKIQQ